jgi:hypothetical protein
MAGLFCLKRNRMGQRKERGAVGKVHTGETGWETGRLSETTGGALQSHGAARACDTGRNSCW